ncbi:MAG: mandelate racemase/muconate lactonizing enzyme family protein [Clostridia bacterium]|nr:mandelate racemase/muconate lactonizing enzyme family protein [Clostridia bacterium]MCI1999378.1 mandelate racemase/muconate lactonizing enzyme family protein [Clostridia bacterium]MCI2015120.1 mandelate racemase/muconate lactonizing enzyme family protein [Clostridia bacterium]
MKITAVETIQLPAHPRHIWVMIHTDEGITGIGEATDKVELTKIAVHNFCAEIILGQNPLENEKLWATMYDSANYTGYMGAEMRAIGAVDMALWDIKGKAANMPVYDLLGGKTQESLRVYNTCISYGKIRDREMFMDDAGALAEDLLSEGIKAMKIWPLDSLSTRYNGQYVTREEIRNGLIPFKKIRDAVGDKMEIALEMHSRWNLPMAVRIAEEVEQYDPMWFEDPIPVDNITCFANLRKKVRLPILASERLSTKYQFRELFEKDACDIAMFDVSYCGGITECKKIAAMADAYHLPVTTHNCGSPIMTMVVAHLMISCPNTNGIETVRSLYKTFDITDAKVDIRDGHIYLSDRPGLGINLLPEVYNAKDTIHTITKDVRNDQMFAITGDPWAQSPGDDKAGVINVK